MDLEGKGKLGLFVKAYEATKTSLTTNGILDVRLRHKESYIDHREICVDFDM